MTQDEYIIEIDRFSFAIGKTHILRDITLSIKTGEYISIIGPNGAGKTTLLKCIDKIHTGGKGSIRIKKKPVENYRQIELAKIVSYVPQSDGSRMPFTAHDFVMMGRYPHLSPFSSIRKEDEEAVRKAMNITETDEFTDRFLDTLSSGEKQRIFIAAALAQEADILLLDEPTTFLDYKHQSEIHGLLKSINEKSGVTIISVTHDINCAALASHRVVAIKKGVVVFAGGPPALMKNEVLKEIYGKSFLFAKHPVTGQPIVVPEEVGA